MDGIPSVITVLVLLVCYEIVRAGCMRVCRQWEERRQAKHDEQMKRVYDDPFHFGQEPDPYGPYMTPSLYQWRPKFSHPSPEPDLESLKQRIDNTINRLDVLREYQRNYPNWPFLTPNERASIEDQEHAILEQAQQRSSRAEQEIEQILGDLGFY